MKEKETNETEQISTTSAVFENAPVSYANDNGASVQGIDIPSSSELDGMSAEMRAQVYKDIAASIDHAVEERVAELGEKYRQGIESMQEANVKRSFASSEKFSGFGESIAAIDTLIEKVPVLKSLPPDERYTVAYLMNEGIKAREAKGDISAQSLVDLVNSRPDAMRLLEAQRAREMADAYKATPAFAASAGNSSMPANIKSMPRNLDEASREAYSCFGLKI